MPHFTNGNKRKELTDDDSPNMKRFKTFAVHHQQQEASVFELQSQHQQQHQQFIQGLQQQQQQQLEQQQLKQSLSEASVEMEEMEVEEMEVDEQNTLSCGRVNSNGQQISPMQHNPLVVASPMVYPTSNYIREHKYQADFDLERRREIRIDQCASFLTRRFLDPQMLYNDHI